jgi:hypothetical protein
MDEHVTIRKTPTRAAEKVDQPIARLGAAD